MDKEKTTEEEKDLSKEGETLSLQDNIVSMAKKQVETCIKFKQPRLAEIQESLDIYANFTTETLTSRFNIPLPIMGKFVDTLKSKIDDRPNIRYSEDDEADYSAVKKANAMITKDSSDSVGMWALKDRATKTSAIFTGRGIMKYYASSDPSYESNLEPIDLFDFIFEPQGGGVLDNHLFCGQINLFRSQSEIESKAATGVYNKDQVAKLINNTESKETKENDDIYKNKQSRFTVYGLDPNTNNYVGEKLYNLTEMYTTYMGKRYYVLFDFNTGIWIRLVELTEMFKSGRWPYISWATHEDYFNFLSKAPADDIRIIAEVMKILANQMLENNQKKNWGMKVVDMSKVKHPHQLNWRPDGIIEVTDVNGASLDNIIRPIANPDNIELSMKLLDFFDGQVANATGITPEAQGTSEKDAKVGIYYGNLQQVADRLGLYNKSYTEMYAQLGVRYLEGLQEHLNKETAVKYIGIEGVEWLKIKKQDLKFDKIPEVNIESTSAKRELDEAKNVRREKALGTIVSNPTLVLKINPNWLVEALLKNGEFEDEEIRVALDTKNNGSQKILAEAAEAIKECLAGKKPKLNRAATTAYVQKILDYEIDNEEDLTPEEGKRLRELAQAHVPIALYNLVRQQQTMSGIAGQVPDLNATVPGPASIPVSQPGQPTPPGVSPANKVANNEQVSNMLS